MFLTVGAEALSMTPSGDALFILSLLSFKEGNNIYSNGSYCFVIGELEANINGRSSLVPYFQGATLSSLAEAREAAAPVLRHFEYECDFFAVVE
jgi:hypothetical protein